MNVVPVVRVARLAVRSVDREVRDLAMEYLQTLELVDPDAQFTSLKEAVEHLLKCHEERVALLRSQIDIADAL